MLIPFNVLVNKYKPNIKGILHVGAHDCEEKKQYGNIPTIWLEAMEEKCKANNVYCVVVDDVDNREVEFKVTNNGQSSSVLDLKVHLQKHPSIHVVSTRKLKTKRIDTFYKEQDIKKDFANFLNVDIQGYELHALKGMGDLINEFDYIYIEVNKLELYKDCCYLSDIDNFLDDRGFKRVELKMTGHGWGDAFYIRK